MKYLLFSFFILIAATISTKASEMKVLPIPGLCMSSASFQAELKTKKMHLIFFSSEEKSKNIFMVFSNEARQGYAAMYIKNINLTCVLSIFQDAEGLVNWDVLKPQTEG